MCEKGGKYRLVLNHKRSTIVFFGTYLEATPNSRLVWTNEEGDAGGTVTTSTLDETNSRGFASISSKIGDELTQSNFPSSKRSTRGEDLKTTDGPAPVKLLVAVTGKASEAKTAEGNKPVFQYIASLPEPH